MATRNVDLHRLTILPRGTIVQQREGDAARLKWVYQRVAKGFGNILTRHPYDLQLRRHVVPFDPQTAPQLSRRQVFAAAVAVWQSLTASEKNQWTEQGKPHALPGYHWFLSNYLKNN